LRGHASKIDAMASWRKKLDIRIHPPMRCLAAPLSIGSVLACVAFFARFLHLVEG